MLFIGIPLISIGLVLFAGHKWGLQHARYMTGGAPHPANCISCHLYLDQDAKMAGFLEKEYLSPLNMEVTPDGKNLLITAHESNQLVIYDIEGNKVSLRSLSVYGRIV